MVQNPLSNSLGTTPQEMQNIAKMGGGVLATIGGTYYISGHEKVEDHPVEVSKPVISASDIPVNVSVSNRIKNDVPVNVDSKIDVPLHTTAIYKPDVEQTFYNVILANKPSMLDWNRMISHAVQVGVETSAYEGIIEKISKEPASVVGSMLSFTDPLGLRTLFYGGEVAVAKLTGNKNLEESARATVSEIRKSYVEESQANPNFILQKGLEAGFIAGSMTLLPHAPAPIPKIVGVGLEGLSIAKAVQEPSAENIFFASLPAVVYGSSKLASEIRIEKVTIPTAEGEQTYRGLTFFGRSIIGYGSEGWNLGTPRMNLLGIGGEEGYQPITLLETRIIKKNILTLGYTEGEVTKILKTFEAGKEVQFMEPSNINDRLISAQHFKNPDLVRDVYTNWLVDWKDKIDSIYGSSTAYAQMKPESLVERGIPIHDYDVSLKVNLDLSKEATSDLLGRLKNIGENVWISKEKPTLIETPKGHGVDIHSLEDILSSDYRGLEGSWSIVYGENQPSVSIGKLKNVMSLEEFSSRKMGSILTLHPEGAYPEAHRIKDITDFLISYKELSGKDITNVRDLWGITEANLKDVSIDIPMSLVKPSKVSSFSIYEISTVSSGLFTSTSSTSASASRNNLFFSFPSASPSPSSKPSMPSPSASPSPSISNSLISRLSFSPSSKPSMPSPSASPSPSISNSLISRLSFSPSNKPSIPSPSASVSNSIVSKLLSSPSPLSYLSPSPSPSRISYPYTYPSEPLSKYSHKPEFYSGGTEEKKRRKSNLELIPSRKKEKSRITPVATWENVMISEMLFGGKALHPKVTKKTTREFKAEFFEHPEGLVSGRFSTQAGSKEPKIFRERIAKLFGLSK